MNGSPSILIVDDELENFDVLEIMLMAEGYQFYYAANASQALTFLESHAPDVILLDVMMPGTDGIELCRQIKAANRWSHIPIVMVTALNTKEDLAHCLNAGANDFLSKPVNRIELSARVRSMLRIKQQHDDLQHLLQLREDMVSMMVHDLRNPLASIILSIDLLRITNAITETGYSKVDKIATAAQQLQLQIDSLLLLAKLQSGKMQLNLSEIDLYAICHSALADFEAIAAQKDLALVAQLPEPGGWVVVDANIFRRILDNLLSNAIKFSPSHSQITVQAEYRESQGAVIRVADAGPGVNENLKTQIFDKYEIGTPLSGISQTGLGLAFVKLAMDAHHGTICVDNGFPQGSVFTLELPGCHTEIQSPSPMPRSAMPLAQTVDTECRGV